MYETFKELVDRGSLCNYCSPTNYGESSSYSTPNGYYSCEGCYCEKAYQRYLEENNLSENIIKYAEKVKLINKGDFINGTNVKI